MLSKLFDVLDEHVPMSPPFCVSMSGLTGLMIPLGGSPWTCVPLMLACIWLAFR